MLGNTIHLVSVNRQVQRYKTIIECCSKIQIQETALKVSFEIPKLICVLVSFGFWDG